MATTRKPVIKTDVTELTNITNHFTSGANKGQALRKRINGAASTMSGGATAVLETTKGFFSGLFNKQ